MTEIPILLLTVTYDFTTGMVTTRTPSGRLTHEAPIPDDLLRAHAVAEQYRLAQWIGRTTAGHRRRQGRINR